MHKEVTALEKVAGVSSILNILQSLLTWYHEKWTMANKMFYVGYCEFWKSSALRTSFSDIVTMKYCLVSRCHVDLTLLCAWFAKSTKKRNLVGYITPPKKGTWTDHSL